MRLLVADAAHGAYAELLTAAVADLHLCVSSDPAELAAWAASCPLWLGQPDLLVGLLRQGFKPDWLQSTWAGITPLLAADLPRDYRLSRASGIFGPLMAEYLLTYVLAHERHLLARLASQAERHWDERLPGSLQGRRLLLVGAGDIASTVAQVFSALGVQVFGVASQARQQVPFAQVVGLSQLAEQAAHADYLVNLLPDTPATTNLFDARLLAQLKPSALFINAGRGAAVVDADLIAALEAGQLAGAVLDVCREEPLPPSHPFWSTPRLLLTGHSAAPTLPAPMVQLFLRNLQAYRAGQPLQGEVTFSRGY
jgi:phosphoglycerate dehydrogenase-like enzyme